MSNKYEMPLVLQFSLHSREFTTESSAFLPSHVCLNLRQELWILLKTVLTTSTLCVVFRGVLCNIAVTYAMVDLMAVPDRRRSHLYCISTSRSPICECILTCSPFFQLRLPVSGCIPVSMNVSLGTLPCMSCIWVCVASSTCACLTWTISHPQSPWMFSTSQMTVNMMTALTFISTWVRQFLTRLWQSQCCGTLFLSEASAFSMSAVLVPLYLWRTHPCAHFLEYSIIFFWKSEDGSSSLSLISCGVGAFFIHSHMCRCSVNHPCCSTVP